MKRIWQMPAYNTLTLRAIAEHIRELREPCEVEVREPTRNDPQNRAFHSAVSDIARQVVWHGQKLPAGVWKRLLVASWMREQGDRPVMVPALDGIGVDVIYEKTSKLSVKSMSSLIEWTMAFGAENSVKFTTNDRGFT